MTASEKIARSVLERRNAADVLEILSEKLSASELASVLLEVHRRRAETVTFAGIFEQYERTRMFQPTSADVRALAELDRLLFDLAGAFEAIELSPVSPLGLNHLAGIPQNNVLSALRAAEVLADPTTQKALECARRRRRDRTAEVKLCGSHRLLRVQRLPDVPGFFPHFRIFTMSTAGRDTGDERFEQAVLVEHLSVYLELFRRLPVLGYAPSDVRVSISDTKRRPLAPRIERGVLDTLRRSFPEVEVAFDETRTQGRSYYSGYCVQIVVKNAKGEDLPLGDGGFSTWTQSLLSDAKERFFSTAIGTELIAKRLRA